MTILLPRLVNGLVNNNNDFNNKNKDSIIDNDSNNNIDLDNMALQVGERLGQAPALPGIPVDTAHVALGLDLLFNEDGDDSCDNDDDDEEI